MPSPIMLPPTPDLHPIRQELLRGLVQAIRRMSKRQCRDMALKIAAHGIHTLVKPRARGGLKPAQRVRHPRGRQRIVRSICLAIATLSRRSRRGSRGPPFEPPSSQLWAVWPKSSTLGFWRRGGGHPALDTTAVRCPAPTGRVSSGGGDYGPKKAFG